MGKGTTLTAFAVILLAVAATLLFHSTTPVNTSTDQWRSVDTYTASLDSAQEWRQGTSSGTLVGNGQLSLVQHPGTPVWTQRFSEDVASVVAAPSGDSVYVLSWDHHLYRLSSRTGAVTDTFPKTFNTVRDLAVNPGNGDVYFAANGNLHRINTATGGLNWTTAARVRRITYNPATNFVYAADAHSTIRAWHAENGTLHWEKANYTTWANDITTTPQTVYVAVNDGNVDARHPRTGNLIWSRSLPAAAEAITAGTGQVYVGSDTGQVHAYTANGNLMWTRNLSTTTVTALTQHRETVYAGTKTGAVTALQSMTGETVWTQRPHTDAVNTFDLSPRGTFLYTGGDDNAVRKRFAAAVTNGTYTRRFTPGLRSSETMQWTNLTLTGDNLAAHKITVTATFSNTSTFTNSVTKTFTPAQNKETFDLTHRSRYLQLHIRLVQNSSSSTPVIDTVTVNGERLRRATDKNT